MKKYLPLLGYLATIPVANWMIATFGPIPVGFGLLAPAGVLAAGLSFSLRDVAQEHLGKWWTLAAVGVGAAISALISPQLALASGLAFGASELADLLVYTPIRRRGMLPAVLASNVVGFSVDSVLFLWLAFGNLGFLAGQLVGKAEMTILALVVLWLLRRGR